MNALRDPSPSAEPASTAAAEARPLAIGMDVRRAGGFGVGVYIRNLIESMGRIAPQHEYVLIGGEKQRQQFADAPKNFRFALYDRPYDSRWSHLDYGLELRRLGLDVFHMPHRWVPLTTPKPYVVTLHDLSEIASWSGENGGRFREHWGHAVLHRGIHRATRIISVSEATKDDAVRRLGIAPSRIDVIPDAVDSRIAQPVTEDEKRETLERYSIEDPLILYAGRIQPHKNIPRLIEAFAVVRSQLENHWKFHHLKLVIIGDDMTADPNVRHTMLRTRTQRSVRFLGFVPVETLRVFYASATVFLFPSLYEGFGMPPLEAMAHGTPVVTSNVSSLPEAVGDAAVLVNPENVFDIARGLRKVLLEDEFREQLTTKGREQVKKFSWDRSAAQILNIYQASARRAR